jgi:hypothetical protein
MFPESYKQKTELTENGNNFCSISGNENELKQQTSACLLQMENGKWMFVFIGWQTNDKW